MKTLLLILALTCADARLALEVAQDDAQDRHLLCNGPVSEIPDDDPGLVLYEEEIAEFGLEVAKVRLAFDRGESCGPEELGE